MPGSSGSLWPDVSGPSLDRPSGTLQQTTAHGGLEPTDVRAGARWIAEQLRVDGSGVGVATIDSGVSGWHDDLDGRVVHFADFVNAQGLPYDDYGHGTHVAGIIAGSGLDSGGERRGIAPGAHLVVLKALDVTGNGYTSNVIAAIDYAIANRAAYNIRVLNLSVAAGVYESFWKDPLTLAAKRAADAASRRRGGQIMAARRGAPTTAASRRRATRRVLTIGAARRGTADRRDDVGAVQLARPRRRRSAKPDRCAGGRHQSTTDAERAVRGESALRL